MITYDDFAKIDFRTAKIISAEKIEKSEKLYKLQVELEEEKRQIISGIAQYYTPEELVGKTIIVIANLEPRMLMGEESQGMLLATDGDKPVLLTPMEEVTPGLKIC
jgi:methionine--tRNA ligase beta chain